ncbi:MAG: sulfite exporter TauE/SafE [Flavobacteriales bacterium]|jgi:sulfite exporter TauE/SafE
MEGDLDLDSLTAAFVIGLFGTLHCFGMCGGIGAALSMGAAKSSLPKRVAIIFAYNIGRISSYSLLGALVSYLGSVIQLAMPFPVLRSIAAILLILMGFYLAGWWNILTRLEYLGSGLWKRLQPLAASLMPVTRLEQGLALGFLWGWLPCGLVYTALAYSSVQGGVIGGALVMLAFGLGTLPAIVLSGLAASQMQSFVRHRSIRQIAGIFLIIFGFWTGYIAIAHHGHQGGSDNSLPQATEHHHH